MIVAASTTLLDDSRSGKRCGLLPWTLLVIGSVASLAANVAVAEPTVMGRAIAAWPSFALIGAYELLMRQIRCAASDNQAIAQAKQSPPKQTSAADLKPFAPGRTDRVVGKEMRRQAWEWALANRAVDGSLPSGKAIGDQYGRHERWRRLVKSAGVAGELALTTS
jgi:hypothetical protein